MCQNFCLPKIHLTFYPSSFKFKFLELPRNRKSLSSFHRCFMNFSFVSAIDKSGECMLERGGKESGKDNSISIRVSQNKKAHVVSCAPINTSYT